MHSVFGCFLYLRSGFRWFPTLVIAYHLQIPCPIQLDMGEERKRKGNEYKHSVDALGRQAVLNMREANRWFGRIIGKRADHFGED